MLEEQDIKVESNIKLEALKRYTILAQKVAIGENDRHYANESMLGDYEMYKFTYAIYKHMYDLGIKYSSIKAIGIAIARDFPNGLEIDVKQPDIKELLLSSFRFCTYTDLYLFSGKDKYVEDMQAGMLRSLSKLSFFKEAIQSMLTDSLFLEAWDASFIQKLITEIEQIQNFEIEIVLPRADLATDLYEIHQKYRAINDALDQSKGKFNSHNFSALIEVHEGGDYSTPFVSSFFTPLLYVVQLRNFPAILHILSNLNDQQIENTNFTRREEASIADKYLLNLIKKYKIQFADSEILKSELGEIILDFSDIKERREKIDLLITLGVDPVDMANEALVWVFEEKELDLIVINSLIRLGADPTKAVVPLGLTIPNKSRDPIGHNLMHNRAIGAAILHGHTHALKILLRAEKSDVEGSIRYLKLLKLSRLNPLQTILDDIKTTIERCTDNLKNVDTLEIYRALGDLSEVKNKKYEDIVRKYGEQYDGFYVFDFNPVVAKFIELRLPYFFSIRASTIFSDVPTKAILNNIRELYSSVTSQLIYLEEVIKSLDETLGFLEHPETILTESEERAYRGLEIGANLIASGLANLALANRMQADASQLPSRLGIFSLARTNEKDESDSSLDISQHSSNSSCSS
ncbi:MAG: hypothetical protein P1U74_09320 [Legionellaceae bacterium]|nr:hypothetical protein [Legionellaceae bacterium]